LFTFDQLDAMGECDVRTPKGRSSLMTASRRLRKFNDRVLVSIRGTGYKIADPTEIAGVSASLRNAAKRKAETSWQVMQTVDLGKLSAVELDKFIREQAKSATLMCVCKTLDSKKLAGKTGDELNIPTEGKVLALLTNKYFSDKEAK
jgi:hypothetical protein